MVGRDLTDEVNSAASLPAWRSLCDSPPVEAEELAGEAKDAAGARVVLPTRVWNDKLLRDHPELEAHRADVLRAVGEPDHVAADPVYENRRRYYLKDAGPSRWLLVVVSYEQEPARIISAFGNRKDPQSWSK